MPEPSHASPSSSSTATLEVVCHRGLGHQSRIEFNGLAVPERAPRTFGDTVPAGEIEVMGQHRVRYGWSTPERRVIRVAPGQRMTLFYTPPLLASDGAQLTDRPVKPHWGTAAVALAVLGGLAAAGILLAVVLMLVGLLSN
ncbi:hypothetical protein ACSDQ9_07205 [Aestuariimicrobium soli]|uniref:hypothetical protein n=1 Tax=Aestuariimicrobium soli TaxID=2035834 RepID=UPI003EB6BED2